MAFESQSLKKNYAGGFGDVYSMVMMVPKELEMEKDNNLDLRFQVPDLGGAFKVNLTLTSLFYYLGFCVFYYLCFFYFSVVCCPVWELGKGMGDLK